MDAKELDQEWFAWLEDRKHPVPPDTEFTRRVMEAVRTEARMAAGNPSKKLSTKTRTPSAATGNRPAWQEWIRTWLSPRPALAFAVLTVVATLVIQYYPAGLRQGAEDTRIKGEGFHVGYLLKRGTRIATAASGEGFRPGDRLQAIYSADRAGYIRFFSLNASGHIECLSCFGAHSISPAGQDKTLPFALELDADPLDEALVGVWTPGPSEAHELEAWLRLAWGRSARDFSSLERALSQSTSADIRVSFFLLRKKAGL